MEYILADVLTVRERRETMRLNELAKSKETVRQAQAQRNRKAEALREYQAWRPRQEQHLFDRLKTQSASVRDLIHYTHELRKLRKDQAAIAQAADQASHRLASARSDMETARRHYFQAHRKKVKIAEHKDIWTEQEQRRRQRQADNEMEEMGKPRRCPVQDL